MADSLSRLRGIVRLRNLIGAARVAELDRANTREKLRARRRVLTDRAAAVSGSRETGEQE